MESRIFDAANLLTLSRLPISGLIWIHRRDSRRVVAWLALGGLTDVLDGRVARRSRNHSFRIGAWLDPLCDKAVVLSAAVAAAGSVRPLVLSRELVQFGMGLAYLIKYRNRIGFFEFRAAPIGKAATCAQYLAIAAGLAGHRWASRIALLAAIVGSTAAVYYFRRASNSAAAF